MLIERPPFWFRWLFPGAIFRLPSEKGEKKRVFLTFDDGPIPEVTPRVLDLLDRYNIKATFFMVGENVKRNPHLLEEVKKRGHDVGNHTLHHIKGIGTSQKLYSENVDLCASFTPSRLFRPPHGLLTRRQLKALKKNYSVVMYDLITRDYSRRLDAEQVVLNVRKYTRDGSIIVFHDSLKSWPRLSKALVPSLEWLIGEGYEFSLLSEKCV